MSWFMERLRNYRDDRGMMANLRCILVDNKKHRAWPALNRVGMKIDDKVLPYVAGLYATYSEEAGTGNFGLTCKRIEQKRDDKRGDDSKLTPTERRFQHLLSAERGTELNNRVLRMVLLAKSQGVPINYEQLETDLRFWGDRTKSEWASAFWTQSGTPEEEQ